MPSLGAGVGRSLSQLGTDRAEADYDEPSMTEEEANQAIDKARHVVDVVERAIAERLESERAP
jgi:uncharacterized protein (UPF0332 family)